MTTSHPNNELSSKIDLVFNHVGKLPTRPILLKPFSAILFISVVSLPGCSDKSSENVKFTPSEQPPDQRVAVKVDCVSNLKTIGLATRLWAGDHQDNYPWNVSTNHEGTMEFRVPDKDGFDGNANRHFQVMSNELNTPRLLVCPADSSRNSALAFQSLDSTNISYRLKTRSGANTANAKAILMICPIDGNVLYNDLSVSKAGTNQNR